MARKKRKSITVDFVFDIETEDWSKFVVGAVWSEEHGFRHWWHERERDYLDAILEMEGTGWGHNAGNYDTHHVIKELLRRRDLRADLALSGSRVVCLRLPNVQLRDSFAIIPLSLAEASKIAGRYKAETGLPCRCGKNCGGYCSIRRQGMSPGERRKLVEYLEQDCLALRDTLLYMDDYAARYDLDLGDTIGSSAYATARRWANIPAPHYDRDQDKHRQRYQFLRRALYGGRVQAFRPFAEHGWHYDLNSAYPAALTKLSLPVGACHYTNKVDMSEDGAIEATVDVPLRLSHVPPLPLRDDERHRNIYPVGTFKGVWTMLELRRALEVGARVRTVHTALVFDESAPILRDFCQTIWRLRDEAGPKTPLGKWLKLYANSLTGKLSQRPVVRETKLSDATTFGHCSNGTSCPLKCHEWHVVDPDAMIVERAKWSVPPSGHVIWGAYLTAYTRAELHRQLIDDGQDGATAVYCDTDSTFSTSPRTRNIGSDLGQWKLEDEFIEFEAIAPKVYSYIDEHGEFHARCKGIPLSQSRDPALAAREVMASWKALGAGQEISSERGVWGFRYGIRRGVLFEKKKLSRRLIGTENMLGDRIVTEAGMTVAPYQGDDE